MAQQEEKIEKQWCVYCGTLGIPMGYGKIVKEYNEGKTLEILYSEKQLYPPEDWDAHYVKHFDTLLEALKEFHKAKDCYTEPEDWNWKELKEQAHHSFPNENLEENLG